MKTCFRCQRSPLKGHWVSHSNIKTIRRQKLNLQTAMIDGRRVIVCTNCLKTLAKQKTK